MSLSKHVNKEMSVLLLPNFLVQNLASLTFQQERTANKTVVMDTKTPFVGVEEHQHIQGYSKDFSSMPSSSTNTESGLFTKE